MFNRYDRNGGVLLMLKSPDTRLAPQAYEQLLSLIMSGELVPGELVNERRLADLLGMSRTPVRDALLMLEGEGLLERHGSRGLQVKQTRIEDYMEALQVRMLLEPYTARLAATQRAGTDWTPLVTRIEQLIASDRSAGVEREEVREIDDRLHDTISEAAGNRQLSGIIRTLRRQTQVFDLKSVPERLVDTCREHLAIIERIRAGDGGGAAAAMMTHLEGVKASIVRRVTGA
jgi:DNA-binding GntR family transcriptional regulator